MSEPPALLRRGLSRVRRATVSLGAAAVLATGALTWQLSTAAAAEDEATGSTTATTTADDGSTATDDAASSGPLLDSDTGGSGRADASSGSS